MAEEKNKQKSKRPTAEKRMLQNKKQAMLNRSFKTKVKSAIRSFEEAASKKDESAKSKLDTLYSLLDKAVKKNIFKLNKAARLKSRFSQKVG